MGLVQGKRASPVAPIFLILSGLAAAAPGADALSYVGRRSCIPCHAQQARRYEGSHHDRAMEVAGASTVRGGFDGATFTYAGVTSTFFQRDGSYYVRTDGPDGTLTEFRVAYTFGIEPLQQYLIELPGGRLQALSIAWDTRPRAEGGQRWFHLYPHDSVDHRNILHWTGPNQNWNSMCAECHSTNVQKNYDPVKDTFNTRWSEIDVSCEACHGPGSAHVAWAEAAARRRDPRADPRKGLAIDLRKRSVWTLDREAGTAKRGGAPPTGVEVEMCGRCHARRGIVSGDYEHGRPLLDTHRPALLDPVLFEADGQIKDEVYEYQSFLQSRMFGAGVTCTDCHEPHAGKTPGGNATCARCHAPERFDTPRHHFHGRTSKGAGCVACHMPTRNYMVVDARHDHSLRVPRPDLSVKIGTPNACTQCHSDRPPEWAADAAAQWWGTKRRATPHYGEVLHAARRGLPDALEALLALAADSAQPAIVRASAVAWLERFPDRRALSIAEGALGDSDPLLRMAAVEVLRSAEPRLRARLLTPLLSDPVRTVRLDAGRALATVPRELLAEEQRRAADRALEEWRRSQHLQADRAEAHINLGLLAVDLGRFDVAEQEYRRAIQRSPRFPAAYVNLADLYRLQKRDSKGERVLRDGLAAAGRDAGLLHALGLLLVRDKRLAEALPLFREAAHTEPDNARYAYVYGVALHSAGRPEEAVAVFEQALDRHPGDREILEALVVFHRERGDPATAEKYARRLVESLWGKRGAEGPHSKGQEPKDREW